MPFFDVQARLGINVDKWMTIQSAAQPYKIAAKCHAFEKEWIECSYGIGVTRARNECKLEYDDFMECWHRTKTLKRLQAIVNQKTKMMKEGTYTPPDHQSGKDAPRP
ncbi:NADH dehydrogenase [ubiquinone] iron-sulfur protein 5 [Tachyglossus aculeatus]|uniref:NADH dehydrogenase [ubiquinone] iron-sulfur protein 5 n=1 Tax=Tachyglossus aculeatus TaxID=9261 RepID=UPI0018F3E24A|nr:NADH dehydrogenase [ubiquinone] iron-sulfur protein 5 [Tachyglossus aculeatus]XP_038613652.1 NADH dehydrogenase [ubiquinone] iron-sulfur protein 5 [Tachyglossus aculeatus]XP_038613653.1 NADH dehydrogenase [ubiquinone] iron-sulfur protein 5 [Tachyglossus aculeatus]